MYFYFYVYVFLLYVYASSSCQLALFGYPDWNFSVLFPQLQGKCQGKTAKTGHGPDISKIFVLFYTYTYIVCFVSFCVLFVCKYVLYYCHRLATLFQLTNIYHIVSYQIIYRIIYHHITSHHIIYHIILYITSYHIYIVSYILSYHIFLCL